MRSLAKWSTLWILLSTVLYAPVIYATQCYQDTTYKSNSIGLVSVNSSVTLESGVQVSKTDLSGPAKVLTEPGKFLGSGSDGVNYVAATQSTTGAAPTVWGSPYINLFQGSYDVTINPNAASAGSVVSGNVHPNVSDFLSVSGSAATGFIIRMGPNQRANYDNFQFFGDLILQDITNPAMYGKHTLILVGGEYYFENLTIGKGWKIIPFSYHDGSGRANSPSILEAQVLNKLDIKDNVKFTFENVNGLRNLLGPDDILIMVGLKSNCSDPFTMAQPADTRNCNNARVTYTGGRASIGSDAQFFGSLYIYDNNEPTKGTLDIGSNSVLTGSYLADGKVSIGERTAISFSYFSCPVEDPDPLPPVPLPIPERSCHDGYYSLTAPVVGANTAVGDLLYAPSQRDLDVLSNSATSGHFRAFKLKANGMTEPNPEWDAGELMTLANRKARIYTQSKSSSNPFQLLQSISDGNLASPDYFNTSLSVARTSRETIFDPNYNSGANLFGRNPSSLLGQPWRTAPVLASNQAVIFAADDGILYSIHPENGSLKWAWFPRELLKQANAPENLMKSHPWGQLNSARKDGVDYVLGTAMQGKLRFSLKLDAKGDLTSNPAWIDFDASASTPNGDSSSSIYAGGAAPVVSIISSSRVAYIKSVSGSHKLIMRNIHNSAGVVTNTLTNPTSNLIYISDTEYYYADNTGKVRNSSNAIIGDIGKSEKITSLTSTYLEGDYGSSELYLLANSATRIAAFAKNSSGTWNRIWYSDVSSSSGPDVPKVRPVNGIISARPSIVSGAVLVPVTDYADINFDCDNTAFVFGPLDLKTGEPQRNILSLNNTLNWSSEYTIQIGGVESLGLGLSTVGSKKYAIEFSGTDLKPKSTKHGEVAIETPIIPPTYQKGWRELTTYRK